MNRTLYFGIGSACLFLIAIVAAEFDWSISTVEASPNEIGPVDKPAIAEPNSVADIDKLTDEILARPLFSPGRHPPAPPLQRREEDVEEVKTPPVLTGRLAGMMIGPNQLKEAVFTRESEPPIAVKEGEAIDGWIVSSIEPDRVVLTSAFGERVLEPTFAQAARAPMRPPRPKQQVRKAIAPQATAAAPPNPMRPSPMPARVNAFGVTAPGANAPGANRAPVPAAARQSLRQ